MGCAPSQKDPSRYAEENVLHDTDTVFGKPLSDCKLKQLGDGSSVPQLVFRCIDWLDRHALGFPGLYRVSPVKRLVDEAVIDIESGDYSSLKEAHTDPAIVTQVLLRFLDQLPTHLLDRANSEALCEAQDVRAAADVLLHLTDLERTTLTYFLNHLSTVSTAPGNLMNATALATCVLSPLVTMPQSKDYSVVVGFYTKLTERLVCLIEEPEQECRRLLHRVFLMFDLDHSGTIETGELLELGVARRQLGHVHSCWCEVEADALANALDKDQSGTVSADEFVNGFMESMSSVRSSLRESGTGMRACEAVAQQFIDAAAEVQRRRQSGYRGAVPLVPSPSLCSGGEAIQVTNVGRYKQLMKQYYTQVYEEPSVAPLKPIERVDFP